MEQKRTLVNKARRGMRGRTDVCDHGRNTSNGTSIRQEDTYDINNTHDSEPHDGRDIPKYRTEFCGAYPIIRRPVMVINVCAAMKRALCLNLSDSQAKNIVDTI